MSDAQPPLCIACAHIVYPMPPDTKVTLCALNRENVYAERANPNGCGPDGKNWEAVA